MADIISQADLLVKVNLDNNLLNSAMQNINKVGENLKKKLNISMNFNSEKFKDGLKVVSNTTKKGLEDIFSFGQGLAGGLIGNIFPSTGTIIGLARNPFTALGAIFSTVLGKSFQLAINNPKITQQVSRLRLNANTALLRATQALIPTYEKFLSSLNNLLSGKNLEKVVKVFVSMTKGFFEILKNILKFLQSGTFQSVLSNIFNTLKNVVKLLSRSFSFLGKTVGKTLSTKTGKFALTSGVESLAVGKIMSATGLSKILGSLGIAGNLVNLGIILSPFIINAFKDFGPQIEKELKKQLDGVVSFLKDSFNSLKVVGTVFKDFFLKIENSMTSFILNLVNAINKLTGVFGIPKIKTDFLTSENLQRTKTLKSDTQFLNNYLFQKHFTNNKQENKNIITNNVSVNVKSAEEASTILKNNTGLRTSYTVSTSNPNLAFQDSN